MAILYEKRGRIAIITLNRPEAMNALDQETVDELDRAWVDVRDDDDVWVAIITGAGDRAFCAGADLKKLIPALTSGDRPARPPSVSSAVILRDFNLYKPVIAAVNGYCVAGGAEMLCGTDIRIAAEHAQFSIAEVEWGLYPDGSTSVRLPRQIPYAWAMEMLLTGDFITAQQALQIGLINRVVPLAELMPTAIQFAEHLCEGGPLSMRAIKEVVLKSSGMPLHDAYWIDQAHGHYVFATEDAKEGPKAFAQKRKPNFAGR
jgi:enoyl-CoA hydratase